MYLHKTSSVAKGCRLTGCLATQSSCGRVLFHGALDPFTAVFGSCAVGGLVSLWLSLEVDAMGLARVLESKRCCGPSAVIRVASDVGASLLSGDGRSSGPGPSEERARGRKAVMRVLVFV